MKQATIVIRDEVNIKLEGLDLDMRRRLVSAFKYDVPYARYLPAVRLGRWDGKVSYFQLGGSTYTNLLPEILSVLEQYNWDVELDDQRDYSVTFAFEPVTEQRRPEYWLEAVLPPSELERNPAAKDAWDRFQVIAGLSNIRINQEYH
jgi:hypothetical protein